MAQTLGELLVNIKGDTTQLITSFNKAENAVNKTTKNMGNAIKGFIAAYAGLSLVDASKEFVRLSDSARNIESRLKLVTKSTQELAIAQDELFKISQNASIEFESTVDLYSRMARSTRDLNVTQEQLLKVTDTISKALVVSGGEASSMNAALVQLSQGFASGTLRGEELNSVIEQTPRLAEAIAQGMGVSLGALRDIAGQGKLTSEVLIKAILSQSQVLNEESLQIAQTTEKTEVKISNSLIRLASNIDNLIGFGNTVNNVLATVTESMDNASKYLESDGYTIIATVGKIKDNFVLLGVDIKNVAELLLDSVGIMAFGALEPITRVLYESTQALNELGLSSDETLKNSFEFYNFAQKGLTNFKESAVNNLQDIDNAYKQSKITIEERVRLLKEENKTSDDNNKATESVVQKKQKLISTENKQVESKKELVKQLEIQKEKEKEYLSSDDWKEYYNSIGDYSNAWLIEQGEIYAKWQENLSSEDLTKKIEIEKAKFYESLQKEKIKPFEFDIDLDDFDNSITNILKSFDKLNEATKKHNEYLAQSGLTKEEIAKADAQNTSNQLKGYSNLAGAISSMFEQGSKDAEAFRAIQTSLAMVEGVRAVLSALANGDPYTAIARGLAVASMVKPLLSSIGLSLGMNSSTTTSDSFSSMTANTGSGSTLGDNNKVSESVTNALKTLEDFAEPQFQTLVSMNRYLETIATNIGGVTSLLIRQGGFAFGEGYSGFDTGYKNNLYTAKGGLAFDLASNSVLGQSMGLDINKLINSIPVLGDLNKMTAGILNSVIGGVFGKTSTSQALTDSGLYFADTFLKIATDEIFGKAYQTISTTVKKKSWFGSSESTSIGSYFNNLDDETNRQFSLVLDNLYSTVLESGKALDSSTETTAKALDNFIVSIGKVSLLGKTGDQIQETLTSIFGRIGDDIAKTAFPLLSGFQQIGEGMFETLTRVATGMEVAEYYVGRLGNRFDDVIYTAIGNKQGDVGFEALLQSITGVENATYPTNNGLLNIIKNLDLTAEELYTAYTNLDELRDRLIFLKQEAQGLSNSMIYGAGSVSDLNNGFKSFFENFLTESEQLSYETSQLIEQFNNLGIALPISKDGFKDLLNSLDLTTESGQELYGRLIILSESFSNVADKTAESIQKLQDELDTLSNNSFDTFISSIEAISSSINDLRSIAQSFLSSFSVSNTGTVREQILEYNKLRKTFDSLFENGTLKAGAESQAKDIYSQLSSLGQNLGQSQTDLVSSLKSQFEMDLSKFDLTDEILKVSIVDGLGDLENLTEEQKNRVNTLIGTTSTEDTLYSLNEYMKKQLEVLQKTQAEETEKLSSKTLTYGDYVGKQEQIDIANLLGISYESAKPLIEQVQSLSISKNPSADIAKMVGFTGETFSNATAVNQLKALAQYSNVDINSNIKDLSIQARTNYETRVKAESQKKAFLDKVTNAYNVFQQQKAESDNALAYYDSQWHQVSAGDNGARRAEDIKNGIPYEIQSPPYINEKNLGAWQQHIANVYNPYLTQFNEAVQAYKVYEDLLKQKSLLGYAVGSTNIPNDQIAQVHKGEIIVPQTFSEGLRNGDLSLSKNIKTPNLENFNILNNISGIIENVMYNMGEYQKKTYDILDDVINGRNTMRVKTV